MTEAASGTLKAQALLRTWEIPEECVMEGLEFWQKGHYGPTCKGQLKNRNGSSSAVVVKSLKGTAGNMNKISFSCRLCVIVLSAVDSRDQSEEQEFVDWILFHATVCKHQNVVKMLFCQTDAQPISLILEACSPGDLLSFLWTLRNVIFYFNLHVNNQARGEGAEIYPSALPCGCALTSCGRN